MKKMFAIVLALMLCVSVLSVAAFAAEGEMVIHVDAPDAWAECYAYNWPESLGGWPGTKLTADANGEYTATVKTGFDGMVIGEGNGKPQTVDITDLDMSKAEAWIVIGEAGADGKHTYTVTYEKGGEVVTPPVEEKPAADATYVVAGSSADVFGAEWDPSAEANKMTKGDDGIYSITYTNVAAGTYSLKVTDGSWTNSWGGTGENGNFDFELTAASDVTVKFNPANKQVSIVIGDEVLEGPVTTGDVSLAAVSVALLAATAGLVVVVSKKKEF